MINKYRQKRRIYSVHNNAHGFTILELIIVVIILGILAAIVFVSYSGIQEKVYDSSLQSDIANMYRLQQIHALDNDSSGIAYYSGDYDSTDGYDSNTGFRPSNGNVIDVVVNSQGFCIRGYNIKSSKKSIDDAFTRESYDGACSAIAASASAVADSTGDTIWLQISSGSSHTCAISSLYKAYCWGSNGSGRLGDGTTINRFNPTEIDMSGVLNGKTVKYISAGDDFTCAIASDDQVYCWGENGNGQLGNGLSTDSSSPVSVTTSGVLSGKTVKSLSTSTGSNHSCVVASDNLAYCWGYNWRGQVGNNSTTTSRNPAAVDTSGVLNGLTVKSISTGSAHTCAIASDDLPYCWGYSNNGQLGDGSTTTYSMVPVSVDVTGVLSGKTIKSIESGYSTVCTVASDDLPYCWGYNYMGALGINSSTPSYSAVPVATYVSGVFSGKTIKSVSSGSTFTCAIASDDLSYCWGNNGAGQIGDGTIATRLSAVAVSTSGVLSDKTIKSISAGHSYICAIASDDQIYCWGDNGSTQQGHNKLDSLVPNTMGFDNPIGNNTFLSITGSDSFCAIASDDNAYCWGEGNHGRLGNGLSLSVNSPEAVYKNGVLSGKTIKDIKSSSTHSCVIASDDQAYCWGTNDSGQLGNNSSTDSSTPVAVDTSGVLSGKTIKAIAVGSSVTCTIASDDNAYCWGSNTSGKLGDGSTTYNSKVPVAVDTSGVLNEKTILSISSNGAHVCVIASDNQTYCWGYNNHGQLGNNSTTYSNTPVAVDTSGVLSGSSIKSISVGAYITCAINSNDLPYCWGEGGYGKLGNGGTSDSLVPVAIDMAGALSGKTVKSISAGNRSSCLIASDNQAYCWGWGNEGEMGNGTNTLTNASPVAVSTSGLLNEKTILSINAGYGSNCVIASDDNAYCWGYNAWGYLGNKLTSNSNVPVLVNPQ